MSSCSRQYASRHISGLKKAYESTSFTSSCPPRIPRQQPLLFLYPSWFRQCWHHQYHTDREPGPGGPPIRKSRSSTRQTKKQSEFSPFKRLASPPIDPLKPSLVKQKRPLNPNKHHYRRVVDSQKVFSALSAELDDIEPTAEDKIVFTILRAHARVLVGHGGAEAWVHHEDTGCVIKVTPCLDDAKSKVSLDGSDSACELAKKYIESVERTKRAEDEDTTAWKHAIYSLPPRADVSDLPKPPKWSMQAFSICVDALVRRRRHHGMDQIKDRQGRHHNARAAAMLADLFRQPETAPFASSTSFEKALRFCREHTELSQYAQRIFSSARNIQLPLGIAAYNEELANNLIIKNSKGLKRVIQTMREGHVKPDSDTWTLILQYAESAESRRYALERCLEAGKLIPSDQSPKLIQAFINGDMIDYLSREKGLMRFLEDMDRMFGEDWLTTKALVRMLRICRIGNARVREASELLGEVAKRRDMAQIMDRACFVELVRLAKKAGSLRDALEVILSQLVQTDPTLHQVVLEPLFELAWLKRSLNLCRLLWVFACTWGKVTFRMKDILWHSMQGNFDQSLDVETKNWQRNAGKLIISQPRDVDRIRKALPHLFGDDSSTSVLLKLAEPVVGLARHEQMQLAQLLIERDVQAWRFYHSMPLAKMRTLLMDAFETDSILRTTGAWQKGSTLDLFSAGMHKIVLKPRSEPLQYRQENEDNAHRGAFVFNDIPLDYHTLEIKLDALMAQQKAKQAFGVRELALASSVDGQSRSLFPMPSNVVENQDESHGTVDIATELAEDVDIECKPEESHRSRIDVETDHQSRDVGGGNSSLRSLDDSKLPAAASA